MAIKYFNEIKKQEIRKFHDKIEKNLKGRKQQVFSRKNML